MSTNQDASSEDHANAVNAPFLFLSSFKVMEMSSRIFRSENELTLSTVEKHVLWLLLNEVFSPAPAGLNLRIMHILTTQSFYRGHLLDARLKLTPPLYTQEPPQGGQPL